MSNPKLGPTGAIDVDVELAHRWSSHHREELFTSEQCGCFYCLDIFPVEAIDDWTDSVDGVGQTALCPRCGVDSVIGSVAGFPIERWFLERMRQRWFG
jgi:hypothetical protein